MKSSETKNWCYKNEELAQDIKNAINETQKNSHKHYCVINYFLYHHIILFNYLITIRNCYDKRQYVFMQINIIDVSIYSIYSDGKCIFISYVHECL